MSFEADPARAGLSRYTPEQGRAVCARVAAGESLRRIGIEAGWPSPQTVWKWARAHPEFGEALAAAQKAARISQRLADRAAEAGRRARREPWRRGGAPLYSPELADEICQRIAEGETLIAIARDPDMPAYRTILRWARRHPEFEEAYSTARRLQADYLFDEGLEVTRATRPGTVWADRLRFDGIRWAAARLAPHKYGDRLTLAAAKAAGNAADTIVVVKFVTGPNGELLVAPPRCAEEAARWEQAYGRPYDGPGLLPGLRGPGGWEALE